MTVSYDLVKTDSHYCKQNMNKPGYENSGGVTPPHSSPQHSYNVAQLNKRWSAKQEATLAYTLARPAIRITCYLCNDFWKRLDFLVFSDKDGKP